MNAINFVVRTRAGEATRGSIVAESGAGRIDAGNGNEISLNLAQADLRGYDRVGTDLHITLADGRIIVVENYFNADGSAANRLFLSSGGELNEVSFVDGGGSVLFANYGPTEAWGKWSPSDDLIFYERPQVIEATAIVAPETENDVSMLAAGLLGGGSLLGMAGGGAAVLGAAAVLGSSGGNSSSGGAALRTVNDGETIIGGDDVTDADKVITVTGKGVEGDVVTVVIGEETETTTVGESGEWSVEFEGETFPADGEYTVNVEFTDTDGGTHDATGGSVVIDTTPPVLSIDGGTQASGEIFNAVEYDGGMMISGMTEAGATVTVTILGVTHTTVGGADGSWSVTYSSSELPAGEYVETITVRSVDSFSNSTTMTANIQIDTVPHPLTIDVVGTDGVLSASEVTGDVTITGTSTPGAVVTVTVGGITQDVTTTSAGTWSMTVAGSTFASGEYDMTVSASTVDIAGNPSSTSRDFHVDTVTNVTVETSTVETDGVVNAAERSDGVEITGTTDAGSTVMVTMAGSSLAASVAADGSWSVTFPAGTVPTGEQTVTVTAVATDAYGNQASASGSLDIDTLVNRLDSTNLITGDNVVNAAEAAAGFTVTGVVEAGSTVSVTFNGIAHSATVDAAGNWSVMIPASSIPMGTGDRMIQIDATDAAGNTASMTRTIHVDTDAPDAPVIESYERTAEGIRYITTNATDDAVDISEVQSDGSIDALSVTDFPHAVLPETVHYFDGGPVPDGSHLVVSRTDDAGNTSGTYLVFDESTTSVVDLDNANLSDFNIETVDLQFAEESELTITEDTLLALSSNSDALTVLGGVDDMVTITGATLTGTATAADGSAVKVYALGDDGTVMVDEEITNVII